MFCFYVNVTLVAYVKVKIFLSGENPLKVTDYTSLINHCVVKSIVTGWN